VTIKTIQTGSVKYLNDPKSSQRKASCSVPGCSASSPPKVCGSCTDATVMYVVITRIIMSRRKADLRLAQLMLQDGVTVKGNILYQPLYAPVAYPSMFPRAMKSEKYALAIRVLLGSFSAI
jgi:hypothetical protein